jgi:xanthine dehydrogenase YagR molybdenum-binding subunit
VFAEVHVDEDLGTIHVERVVTAVAPGRVVNPTTARSQVMGGIVWGIGMALEEESVIDRLRAIHQPQPRGISRGGECRYS